MQELVTPREAAKILCLSEMTLRKWRWEGKGPKFVKIGRKVAYRMDHLEHWTDNQIRRSTSDDGTVSP